MAKKFDNEGRVALWEAQSKSGLNYLNGTVELDGVPYKLVLFKNDSDNPVAPIYTGKLEKKED